MADDLEIQREHGCAAWRISVPETLFGTAFSGKEQNKCKQNNCTFGCVCPVSFRPTQKGCENSGVFGAR